MLQGAKGGGEIVVNDKISKGLFIV